MILKIGEHSSFFGELESIQVFLNYIKNIILMGAAMPKFEKLLKIFLIFFLLKILKKGKIFRRNLPIFQESVISLGKRSISSIGRVSTVAGGLCEAEL